MSTIVANCPRCGAVKITLDIISDVYVGSEYGWLHYHEVTARCRHCHRPSLLLIGLEEIREKDKYGKDGSVTAQNGDISSLFKFKRAVTVADLSAKEAPEFLSEDISKAFNEGTRCLAINCHNAAAAMFRLCLDLGTKSMLPNQECEGGPNSNQRKNLAPRLEWLFAQGLLPADLHELSVAVKDYGNDGAHDGNLDENESEDLYDFAFALLDRLYTQPARLEQMRARRDSRKNPPTK